MTAKFGGSSGMLRRGQFIGLLATAVAWPLALSAQQSEKALIVYVSSRSADTDAPMLAAVRRGLSETGFIEGRNVTIEYRFADTQYERLPVILTELSRRQVAVILYGGGPPNVQTVINSA